MRNKLTISFLETSVRSISHRLFIKRAFYSDLQQKLPSSKSSSFNASSSNSSVVLSSKNISPENNKLLQLLVTVRLQLGTEAIKGLIASKNLPAFNQELSLIFSALFCQYFEFFLNLPKLCLNTFDTKMTSTSRVKSESFFGVIKCDLNLFVIKSKLN